MKVERKEKAFEPVVITLESQEEFDAVESVLAYYVEYNAPFDSILKSLRTALISVKD